MGALLILTAGAVALVVVLALRLWLVLHSQVIVPRKSVSLMVVAGSGGHTTEMLRLLGHLSSAYCPRHYVVADTDEFSAQKIHSFEQNRADRDPSTTRTVAVLRQTPLTRKPVLSEWASGEENLRGSLQTQILMWPFHAVTAENDFTDRCVCPLWCVKPWGLLGGVIAIAVTAAVYLVCRSLGPDLSVVSGSERPAYYIHRIPRSREVQQSWLSTVFTTLHAAWLSFPLTYRVKPDLVLCNGPGTCVPICASALLLGLLGVKRVLLVYVESVCRVERLSLSGTLLRPFCDYFLVQWPALKAKHPGSVFLGRLV